MDYNQLKARTIIALNKLGHQKFSADSGGYSLETWMRGVNLLLDEFEEKVDAGKLPPEYTQERRELTDRVLKPVDLSSIDKSLSELKQSEEEVMRKLEEARTGTASRIHELKNELAKCSAELEEEKGRLSSLTAEQHSKSFFKRLFGRNSTALVKASEGKVTELESRLRTLPGEIQEQQKSLRSVDDRSSESQWAEEWRVLESLQVKLKELGNERLEKIQLVREREEITTSIVNTISGITLDEDNTEGESISSI